jgi:hypothetical protein
MGRGIALGFSWFLQTVLVHFWNVAVFQRADYIGAGNDLKNYQARC